MCQLLGINSATPTSFSFCFKGFCQRGGGDCPGCASNRDGWGLAMHQGRGLRTFLDVEACSKSPVAQFIQAYPTCSSNIVAHVRCATHGCVGIENCHPFTREMWGIAWAFVHNGDVPVMAHQQAGHHVHLRKTKEKDLVYHAMGDTDSEALFCSILNALRAEFHSLPTLPDLFRALQELANELVDMDNTLINNFLLTCGPDTLFCYSWPGSRLGSTVWNGMYYIVREPPMTRTAHLVDLKYSMELHLIKALDQMAVVATKPLTDEDGWTELKPGELVLFNRGVAYTNPALLEQVEAEGHGLLSKCIIKASNANEKVKAGHEQRRNE